MPATREAGTAELARRLGPRVRCALVTPQGDEAALHPAERDVVARAVPVRRAEFAAGRACARRLLAELGVADAPLLPGPDRAPRWPAGAVGSITHSRLLCAVAVARAADVLALGLDTEPDEPLEEELWAAVLAPRERDALDALPAASRGRHVRRVFAAKEAVYKALHPLTGAEPGFHDVQVALAPGDDAFVARLLPAHADPRLPEGLHGVLVRHEGSLIAGLVLAEGVGRRRAGR